MMNGARWERSPLLADIAKRYPHQFLERPLQLEQNVPAGWLSLFEGLCADVDQLLNGNYQNFHWSQLKTKYGSARWYYRFDLAMEQVTKDQLSDLVYAAREQTERRCIACGRFVEDAVPAGESAMCPEHEKAYRVDGKAFLSWVDP